MADSNQELAKELLAMSGRLEQLATALDTGEVSQPDDQTSTAAEEPASNEAQAESVHVSYDDVKAAVIEAAKVDRNKAVEVLQKFGASKAPELAESDYAAAVKKLKELSDGR